MMQATGSAASKLFRLVLASIRQMEHAERGRCWVDEHMSGLTMTMMMVSFCA